MNTDNSPGERNYIHTYIDYKRIYASAHLNSGASRAQVVKVASQESTGPEKCGCSSTKSSAS